jgi:lysine 2,3-aminomutase
LIQAGERAEGHAGAPGAETGRFLGAFVARAIAESAAAERARRGREARYPEIADELWYDWRWQLRNRISTLDELTRLLPIPSAERGAVRQVLRDFRMGITPYSLSLIDARDPADPVRRQLVPEAEEHGQEGEEDPLAEELYSPVPGITHRYPDRCLMVVTNACAVYCRYCTRKRIMYEDAVPEMRLSAMLEYIARTPSIRDVVVSGGDPLGLPSPRLERILAGLRAIPHVEIVRIGSRIPVALPMRVTGELCELLSRYHPLWVNVHFNHPNEITPDAARACDLLLRAGIPLNNQAVLLRGVNDALETMRALVHGLLAMRVRPYYLYVCDPVRGAAHFRTSVTRGVEIIEGLRGHTSGLAIPQLVVDTPGGGGKVPVNPETLLAYGDGVARLRNYQGRVFEHRDPSAPSAPLPVPRGDSPGAVEEREVRADAHGPGAGSSAWVRRGRGARG